MDASTPSQNGRLLIVSNRLSVRIERGENGFEYHPSVGGLATALSRLPSAGEMLWVGWPGIQPEESEREEIEARLLEEAQAVPVFLSEEQLELYYDGFSNATVWPLFHYFPQYAHYDAIEWNAYQQVNQLFRDKVVEVAQPGDTIWVQDYHLLLLPSLLREALPDASIGFFLHIPFPSYEIFRMLPWRNELLLGLVGSDLIGFHTFGYARHFLSSLVRLVGLEHEFGQLTVGGRAVKVDVFPLGIDVDRFAEAGDDPAVQDELADLRAKTTGRKVILSLDRLDFTKGIPQRLEAFARFLELYPQWQGRVTLIALCVPSRTDVPEYQALKRQVDELVGRINGRFGLPGWTPIWYLYRSVPFEQLAALYQLSDVALVTPLRDGMNLVAKEYLAARTDGEGMLVLSETAGAADELGEALVINPHDEQEMIEALHEALQMPLNERKSRNAAMLARLRRYDTAHWADDFLRKLEATAQLRSGMKQEKLAGVRRSRLLRQYRECTRRLLFLDYDGTLVPFASQPRKAAPDAALLDLLKRLIADPRNTVVVISGRDYATLELWIGEVQANLVAEHGSRIRLAGDETWQRVDVSLPLDWKEQLRPLMQMYVDRTPGALLEEKEGALAWHYRSADPEVSLLRVKELMGTLEAFVANTPLHLLWGSRVLEVKSSNATKGTAVQRWLTQTPGYDFILAVGDDVTDEDMFGALPEESWSIKVGRVASSKARFYVPGVVEVRQLLNELIAQDTLEQPKAVDAEPVLS